MGKWAQSTCKKMIGQLSERIQKPTIQTKLEMYTDGNDDYVFVLPEFFEPETIKYSQIVKIREKGKVIGKFKRDIYGHSEPEEIETTDIENFNGILRASIGRLVRRTKGISKLVHRLECAIAVFQFYWNFVKPLNNKESPAMKEKLASRLWTWEELFLWKVKLC